MGGAQSKSSAEILNETTASVLVSAANDCSLSATGIQVVRTSGVTIGQLNYANMRISQTCLQNLTVTNDLIEKITSEIQQSAAAKTTALLPGLSSSKNRTKIRNAVATNITNSVIQKAASSVTFGQDIGTSGLTVGQANILSGDVAVKAVQEVISQTNLSRDIEAAVGQSSKSETDTSPISQLFSGIWGWVIILVVILVIVIAGIALVRSSGSSDVLVEPVSETDQVDENSQFVNEIGQELVEEVGESIMEAANPVEVLPATVI